MNKIQIFKNEQFGEIRATEINGKEYFYGVDIAGALGYERPSKAVSDHCKGILTQDTIKNDGGYPEKLIPEGDIYRLIMKSQLPQAERFEMWVFDDVLPTIRKHGMYATNELLDNPDLLIEVATKLKEERQARIAAEKKIEIDKPKVIFADAVSVSHTSILVGDLAKLIKQNGYDIGGNRLFEWMREEGYLIKRKGTDYNMPTQYSMDLGLYQVKETSITHSDGHTSVSKTSKVTGKGQIYFINKFKSIIKEKEIN